MTLTIHDWSNTFENADTRKRQRLGFFHCPSGCDSKGYIELTTCHGSSGLAALGVFQALCQLMATLPKDIRGKFARTNGDAMTLTQLALRIRVEVCHLEEAVKLLSSEEIGWLKWQHQKDQSATDVPAKCQQPAGKSATPCQSSPGFVQGKGKGKGKDSKLSNAGESDDLEIIRREDPQPDTPPDGRPSVDEVKRYSASAPVPISVQCAIAFHDTQEMQGWVTNQGHPIADWRAALRRYASRWNEHEKGKGPAPRGGKPQPTTRHTNGYNESTEL